jgi:hypothetical protein
MPNPKSKDVFYKFAITLQWPTVARNRSIETIQSRPDIVHEMNNFMQKVENVCNLILRKDYKIDYKHNVAGVKIQFSSGQDLYEFIVRQPEFEWEILPKIGTINSLNGEYKSFDLVYQPTGFSVV